MERSVGQRDRAKTEALYVCHPCAMIGPLRAAIRHKLTTEHHVDRLTDAEADGVREVWHREDRCWRCGSADHYAEGCSA